VVLVRTRNPLNIGTAARAMSNFGSLSLRLVNPYEASFREARSAVGASAMLKNAQEYANVADAVADCSLVVGTTAARDRQLQHPLKRLEQAAKEIHEQLVHGRVALLFGSEKTGLSNRDLSYCHFLLRIPTREDHGSMNLGQAVAVCLYELNRQGTGRVQPADVEPANSAVLNRITASLMEALRISGYFGAAEEPGKEEGIRRLVHRLNLSSEDATVWLGMLRQVLWKLRS
jgi:TrmH family RNA methyltransferase